MSRRSLTLLALSVLAGLAFASGTASATTIVPMTDVDLAVSSRVIVEGTVAASEPAWSPERGVVFTYTTVNVERVFKGPLATGQIVIKEIGGRTDTEITETFGAPALQPGQRVLLYLNTDSTGALRIAHFAIGAYRIERDPTNGTELAVRTYDGGVHVSASVSVRGVTDVAPHDSFVSSLQSILATHTAEIAEFDALHAATPVLSEPAEYRDVHARGGSVRTSYAFLQPGFRWFEPDTGDIIPMKVNTDDGPTASGGVEESKLAFEAWSSITGCNLRIEYAGSTTSGGRIKDGVNSISFGDPLNEMDDPVNCAGVVALSGVTATKDEQRSVGGKTFVRISEGDVVVNDHFECLLSDSITLSEVVTHEIGHSIGLAHSSESFGETDPAHRDATMFFATHIDGRGATLRADDCAAVRFLYNGPSGQKPFAITSSAIPDAQSGAVYSYDLDVEGGSSPYLWSLQDRVLPDGIALGQDGHLWGTPTARSATFTLVATDSHGASQTIDLIFRSTATPSPFVDRALYKAGPGKLTIAGRYLAAGATITINGEVVAEGTQVKFKEKKSQLVVNGSRGKLNINASGQNTLVVTLAGQPSNTLTF